MLDTSELILTPRGTIYHLDLHPDEVADTIITVGAPERVPKVSRYFDRLEHTRMHREFVSHTGYIGRKRLTVVSTGIGPDNIDIVLNELDALANIDFNSRSLKNALTSLTLIRLGTSGSLQEDIPVGSMLASTFAIGLDNLLHYYVPENNAEETFLLHAFRQHTRFTGNPIQPYIAQASIHLLNHFTSDNYHHGITVTCPGFYAPQGRKLRSASAFPDLIPLLAGFHQGPHRLANLEMETAALYGLSKLMGHHCVSISTIVTNRRDGTFSKDAGAEIDRMIKNALEIIEQLK